MEETPVAGALLAAADRSFEWLQAFLSDSGAMPQAIAIIGAVAVARTLTAWLGPRLRQTLRRVPDAHQPALRRLAPVVFPTLWLLLQWFSLIALQQAEVPALAVHAVTHLLLAWVGVRIALSMFATTFWSHLIAGSVAFIVALKVSGLWTHTLHILDAMMFSIGSVRVSMLGLIEAALILGILWWLAFAAARFLDRWASGRQDLSPAGRVLLGKVFRITAMVLAVFVALHAIGVDVTTLAVFSGAAGLAVGFGLQKPFSNLVSGIILLLDGSLKPGDVIAVGEHYGWIDVLGARYVSVVTRDGIEHLIPNEDVISSRVENWSHSNNLLRLRLPFGVAYGTDLRRATALAEQAAHAVERVLASPPPNCLLITFGDSSVDLELRFWINDPRNGVHNVRSEVMMRLWEVFAQQEIAFPYPQRDLHVKDPVPVRLIDPAGRVSR